MKGKYKRNKILREKISKAKTGVAIRDVIIPIPDIAKKLAFDGLSDSFKRKYTIFELNDIIAMLQNSGLTNNIIVNTLNKQPYNIKLSENTLYNIIPIRNINNNTKQLINNNKIDGYLVGRLMRSLGKENVREDEVMDEVVKKKLTWNEAEILAGGKSIIDKSIVGNRLKIHLLDFNKIILTFLIDKTKLKFISKNDLDGINKEINKLEDNLNELKNEINNNKGGKNGH